MKRWRVAHDAASEYIYLIFIFETAYLRKSTAIIQRWTKLMLSCTCLQLLKLNIVGKADKIIKDGS